MEKKDYFLYSTLIIPLIVALDLITKYLIHSKDIRVNIISFLKIVPVKNTGAAFGMFVGQNIILIFVSLVIIGLISYYFYTSERTYVNMISLSLIMAGALGNLYDRVFIGFVRDFISVSKFPVFNVADSAISVGAMILVIGMIIEEKNTIVKNKK
jgi:signal peptidase II